MRRRRGGMTLVELTISMIIMILLVGALFSTLMMGKTLYQGGVTRAGGRQDLQVALWKIALEMRDSDVGTLTDGTAQSPAAISFLSAQDRTGTFATDSGGAPQWQKYVIYYIPAGTSNLMRKEAYGSFTTPLSTSALASYCDGKGTRLASSVAVFDISTGPQANEVRIMLTVQNVSAHGKIDRQAGEMNVMMNN